MSSYRLGSLSVVLPAYNEEEVIEKTVAGTVAFLRTCGFPFEVLVVDDGSTDSTAARVRSLQQRGFSEVRLIGHERNRGYGEALRSGFNAAINEWILLMDADGQFDIASLNDFAEYAGKYDLVIGRREKRQDPRTRLVLMWGYNNLVWLLFGLPYDFGCAFKLFRRDAWQQVQPIKSRDHKIFSVEWLLKSVWAGWQIKEVPVRHLPRTTGKPTGARLKVVAAMAKELIRLRFS